MKSSITFEISYDDDRRLWTVGCLSSWDGQIELCRSHECGPFTTVTDVWIWLSKLYDAWQAPELGSSASESLHDTYTLYSP